VARALPARAPAFALPRLALAAPLRAELTLVLALVAIGLVSHGLNMFSYPAFTAADDEGIYASQAWAVLRQGALSPYTYVYDHVPGGWILVAAWMAVTGGPHAFGSAVDSGRVLMLLLHLATLPLLYRVARKLGCSVPIAAFATLLFTLSPLAIFYQRRLLLDNIMLFWALLSLDLLLDGWGRLSRVTLSGLSFGVALLSKETAIFLLPAMVYIAWQQRWRHQGRFALFGWLVPVLVVASWYPLYALLKGELWPAGGAAQFSTSGYGNAGVSLFDSLLWQVGRDGGGAFNLDNQFWTLLRGDWVRRDALLVGGGVLATALNLGRGRRLASVDDRRAVATGLLALGPLLYLARGGIVFDFYVLLALPFWCLNLAVLGDWALRRAPARAAAGGVALAAAALVAGYWLVGGLAPLYTQRPSQAGRDALAWLKQNVPPESTIITRDDLWTDLREPGLGGPGFPNVQSYTKVAGDPAIRTGVFHDDWQTVDYLVMSPGLQDTLVASNNTVALGALQHAHLVERWSLQGSQLELWKVDKAGPLDAANLAASDAYIGHRFEQSGAFVDADGSVTSEAEAYALLRAVWSDDRAGFDRAWGWTAAHLLTPDGQLAWLWRSGEIVDANSAADAETDTALALLMAGERWDDPGLTAAGRALVSAIWEHDVAVVDGRPYMSAGNWAPTLDIVAVNPSYFAPYAYHVFHEVDPDHDWIGVIDTGYQLLFDASAAPLGAPHSAGLPPDWVGLDRASGQIVPLVLDDTATTRFGFDAPRTYWRVALDQRWDQDGRADAYLRQAGFLRDEVARAASVGAVYEHDGTPVEGASSRVATAGALAALLTLDGDAANALYAGQLVGDSHRADRGLYWDDPNDLYAQEWGWFATALYAGALPDLYRSG
jgi:endo-1,4-beta-D-glucanase Y/4-amino-4-deoxy-L-arabinose transferase-like glycosyltransferase